LKNYGYEKEERNRADVYIKHAKYITRQIGFNNETKGVMLGVHYLTIQELKAINEKVKELGWEV
jgi:hypothetical protein